MSARSEIQELTDLRGGEYARAAWDNYNQSGAQHEGPELSRAEIEEDERRDICSRMGLCLCCGERKRIPTHWHVCLECHEGLESER